MQQRKVFESPWCVGLQVGPPRDAPPPMPYTDEDGGGGEVVHHDIADAANQPSPTAEQPEEVPHARPWPARPSGQYSPETATAISRGAGPAACWWMLHLPGAGDGGFGHFVSTGKDSYLKHLDSEINSETRYCVSSTFLLIVVPTLWKQSLVMLAPSLAFL